MSLRRHTLTCIAACAALLPALGTAPAQAALPAGFVGLASPDVFAGSAKYENQQLARQQALGVTLERQTFDWAYLEPKRGQFNWTSTDRFVLAAARHHISVMPILFGEPRWGTLKPRHPKKGDRAIYPPRKNSDLAAFGQAVVARYGPGGALWAAHPGVQAIPTTDYQIWNEPNLPIYWGNHASAPAYARMLTTVSSALRAVQPQADVMTAGMPQSTHGVPLLKYLKALYAAGAGPAVNTVSVNAYAPNVARVLDNVRGVRAFLNAHSPSTAIWVTELGWSDNGPRGGFRVTSKRMAQLVTGVFRALAAKRGSLKLRGLVYFQWRDARPYPGGSDFWGLHTGLNRLNGKPKPVVAALRKLLRKLH